VNQGRPEAPESMERIKRWPDRAIGDLAARQYANITRRQLLELGVSTDAIDRAVRRGRLYRVHRGVYSLLPARARPALAVEQAALLACGPSALLSHGSAARLHGVRLPGYAREVHVTVTGAAHPRSRPGLVVHRVASIDPQERVRVERLPVTSVARTLLDLAPLHTERQLAPLVDQALRRTSRAKLLEVVERHRGRPGARRLARLLDPARPSADTWSKAEARLLRAIARAGLPLPECNVPIGAYVADLLWREQRVIVEYDSDAYHGGPHAFDRDRARHNDLAALGYEVLHVTERHLAEEPERVIVWIARALDRAGRR